MNGRLLFWVVPLALLMLVGCQSGIDYRRLNTPDGVLDEVKDHPASDVGMFAKALQQVVQSKARTHDNQDPNIIQESTRALELARLAAPRKLANTSDLIASIAALTQLEESTIMADHLKIMDNLTELLMPGGAGALTIAALKALGGDDAKGASELASKLEQALKRRLWLEMLHLWCPVLTRVGEAAERGSALAAQIADKKVAAGLSFQLEFLLTAKDCVELSPGLISAYLQAIDAVATAAPVGEDLASLFQALQSEEAPYLRSMHKAMASLGLAEARYLKEVRAPLPFGATDSIPKTPVEQISELIKQGHNTITFTVPNDRELDILANYFAIDGRDVRIVDLLPLQQNANALALSSDQFVDWAGYIMAQTSSAYGQKPIVILKNVGALNFDSSINDKDAQLVAMGKNFDRLVHQTTKVVMLAPLNKDNQKLFLNSESARRTRLVLSPLHLLVAEKIIDKVVEAKGEQIPRQALTPSTTAKNIDGAVGSTQGTGQSVIPTISARNFKDMAKLYKAYSDQLSVGLLDNLGREYTQRLPQLASQSKEQEHNLAVQVAKDALDMKESLITERRVLQLDSSALESKLTQNPSAFSDPMSQQRALEAMSRIQSSLQKMEEIYGRTFVAKSEAEEAKTQAQNSLESAKSLLSPFKDLGELKVEVDKKIAQVDTKAGDADAKAGTALTKANEADTKATAAGTNATQATKDAQAADAKAITADKKGDKAIADADAADKKAEAASASLDAATKAIAGMASKKELGDEKALLAQKITDSTKDLASKKELENEKTGLEQKITDSLKDLASKNELEIEKAGLEQKITDSTKDLASKKELENEKTGLEQKITDSTKDLASKKELENEKTGLEQKITDSTKDLASKKELENEKTGLEQKITDSTKDLASKKELEIEKTGLERKITDSVKDLASKKELENQKTDLELKITQTEKELRQDIQIIKIDVETKINKLNMQIYEFSKNYEADKEKINKFMELTKIEIEKWVKLLLKGFEEKWQAKTEQLGELYGKVGKTVFGIKRNFEELQRVIKLMLAETYGGTKVFTPKPELEINLESFE